jgi:hypothetical protein
MTDIRTTQEFCQSSKVESCSSKSERNGGRNDHLYIMIHSNPKAKTKRKMKTQKTNNLKDLRLIIPTSMKTELFFINHLQASQLQITKEAVPFKTTSVYIGSKILTNGHSKENKK